MVRSHSRALAVGFTVSAISLLAGCSSPSTPTDPTTSAQADAGTSQCATSELPLMSLEPKSSAEPAMAIPQPPGWESSGGDFPPIVRATLVNQGLTADSFAPTAVVTLEDLTGKVGTPELAITAERDAITDPLDSETSGTLCGMPSLTITYVSPASGTAPSTTVSTLIVAGEDAGKLYAATVTVQTTDPDNSTYVKDRNAMLEGFQFQLPGTKTE